MLQEGHLVYSNDEECVIMLKLLKTMLLLYHVILTITIMKYLPHCYTHFIDMTKVQKGEIDPQTV